MKSGSVETPSPIESLRDLLRLALAEFPDPQHQLQIRSYLRELSQLMSPLAAEQLAAERERAQATSQATGDDEVTLLCKLESYLESVLVGRGVSSGRRS